MLESWPTVSLTDLSPCRTDADGLRDRLHGAASGEIVVAPVSAPGAANLRALPIPHMASEAGCRLLATYLRRDHFLWEGADLVLIDRPCYLAVDNGVVLLEDERILTDSVFQWPHAGSIAAAFGGGFTPQTLAAALSRATVTQPGLWAPLMSRWSRVYGHAITESLVQDHLFARLGLTGLISYPILPGLRGGQAVAAAQSLSATRAVSDPVIRVERLLFATLMARHCRLGTDFRLFAEHTRMRGVALPDAAGLSLGERIYVTRQGAPARPMDNEADLIAALQAEGFRVFSSAGLSLVQQAAAFAHARHVVGPFGSGLVNAAFAAPGATLCELRPLNTNDETPLWDSFFRDLSAVMGFAYGAHVSENPPRTDVWSANLPEILDMVRASLPRGTR